MVKTTIQYFCDRCGKEINLEEYQNSISAVKAGSYEIRDNQFEPHPHGYYELCQECAEGLWDYLQSGKGEDET